MESTIKTPSQIVTEHISNKCKLLRNHPTVVVGHINHERAVTNDYMGRVLYELLQNAVDRAETTIWIKLCLESNSLTIANDGEPFNVEKRQHEPRSDFAALCSIDTSNKQAGESIGNKGIGFKSVFEFSESVQIRSKWSIKDKPWAIRLHKVFRTELLNDWSDKKVATDIRSAISESDIEDKYKNTAPSFYFPEFITKPTWQNNEAVTEIELENLSDENIASLTKLLEDLSNQTLAFVSDIRLKSKLNLLVFQSDKKDRNIPLYIDEKDWIRIDVDTSTQSAVITEEKEKLNFDLDRDPRLSFILPRSTTAIHKKGLIHSYLPTEVKLGVPLHIQGDFYLDVSRKNIDFESNRFNQILLEMVGDALIQAIETNEKGIAELPYILKLLQPFGSPVLRKHIKSILQTRNGSYLADVLASIVTADIKSKPVSFYNSIFQIIASYIPKKIKHLHADHVKLTVIPYFESFSRDDLKIIPLLSSKLKSTEKVATATLLPKPSISDSQVKKLFIKLDKITSLGYTREIPANLNIPNVTVTTWEFPSALSDTLKDLNIWREYEPEAVLRALVRAQQESKMTDEKIKFLKAAKQIAPLSKTFNTTSFRESHPSQRLLIPVIDSSSGTQNWKQAKQSYIPDADNTYQEYFTNYSAIDKDFCQSILGDNYESILLSWGVWNVIPVTKSSTSWRIPIEKIPARSNTLELIAKSWQVWNKVQSSSSVLKQLKHESWIEINKGSEQYITPSRVYFGSHRNVVKGYYLLHKDSLSPIQLSLLKELGVKSLDEEQDLEKIVSTIQLVVEEINEDHPIKGAVLSVYRSLVKRINQLLVRGLENNIDLTILNRLPLLYESATQGRRVATENDQIWYMSSTQKKYKNKINSEDYKWWLANGEINKLANRLRSINILKTKEQITNIEGDRICEDFRKVLQDEYLPNFLALASYGDLPGLANVDEDLVQKRWMVFYIRRVTKAELILSRSTDNDIFEVTQTLSIDKEELLWESLSGDVKKLELYLYDQADQSSEHFKQKICIWFADELFRRRELRPYFEKVLDDADKTLREYGVNLTAQEDAKDSICSWLSDKELDLLTGDLSKLLEKEITTENWHHLKNYQDSAYERFDLLKKQLNSDLYVHLERINPEDRNISKLQAFFEKDENKRSIAGLPNDLSDLQTLLEQLKTDEDRFLFKFDPKNWIVKVADLGSTAAFDKLADSLNYEKAQLLDGISSEPLLQQKTKSTKVTVTSSGSGGSSSGGYGGSVHIVKTDKEQEEAYRKKSERGKASELKFAISIIEDKIDTLSSEEQEHFFSLLSMEYTRLGKLSGGKIIAEKSQSLILPKSNKEWLGLLHIGAFIDGPGYDVIDYDVSARKLLLVEIKSSSSATFPVEIFLSDPERLSALEYNSSSFKDSFPELQWCLYLIQNNQQFDISKEIIEQLELHHKKYEMIDSNLKAKEWVLSGIRVETTDK